MLANWLLQMFTRNYLSQIFKKHKFKVDAIIAEKIFKVKIK
jgi:hypothetical protein